MKYRPNKWLYCICNNNSARTFTPKKIVLANTPLLQHFMSCFFDLVFLFSQHFPCFLFIIKKYCKLLEHLVWFVVSRIRLCILTEFCFKTLRHVITQHNPFTFIFNLFRKCFQSYVRLYYEIIENDAAMEFTTLLFCIFGRRKIFCRNGKLQSISKQYMMCSEKCIA